MKLLYERAKVITEIVKHSKGKDVVEQYDNLCRINFIIYDMQKNVHEELIKVREEAYRDYVDKELTKRIKKGRTK